MRRSEAMLREAARLAVVEALDTYGRSDINGHRVWTDRSIGRILDNHFGAAPPPDAAEPSERAPSQPASDLPAEVLRDIREALAVAQRFPDHGGMQNVRSYLRDALAVVDRDKSRPIPSQPASESMRSAVLRDAAATLRRHGSVHRQGTDDRIAYDREADAVEAASQPASITEEVAHELLFMGHNGQMVVDDRVRALIAKTQPASELEQACAFLDETRDRQKWVHEIMSNAMHWSARWRPQHAGTHKALATCILATAKALGWPGGAR